MGKRISARRKIKSTTIRASVHTPSLSVTTSKTTSTVKKEAAAALKRRRDVLSSESFFARFDTHVDFIKVKYRVFATLSVRLLLKVGQILMITS